METILGFVLLGIFYYLLFRFISWCVRKVKGQAVEKNLTNQLVEKQAALKAIEEQLNNKNQVLENLKEEALENVKDEIQQIKDNSENTIQEYKSQIADLEQKKKALEIEVVELEEKTLYQDFGLYEPQFSFAYADEYKDALKDLRQEQKDLIKNHSAVTGATQWTVDGSLTKGKKMVSDTQKLLLRAFNTECDTVINKVTYANFSQSKKRIEKASEAISKLGRTMKIAISKSYFEAKLKELHLAFEYQQAKEIEKEKIREAKAQERELAKLRKEIEEKRKKAKKEKNHYVTALAVVREQFVKTANSEEKEALNEKIKELESHLSEVEKSITDIDYREANQRAGYVYIISNIGSFGENVYKIGMTRRLEPMDRIYELGGASVPFNFDVHALIFTDDAPALETALHHHFEKQKVNMINTRREFFNVTLDEIRKVIKENFDGTVSFTEYPEATQYRETLKIKEAMAK